MWRRPKKEDTEDDIFKEQQLFLSRKGDNSEFKPAASVCNARGKQHQDTSSTHESETTFSLDLKIVEKNVSKSWNSSFPKRTAAGFPKVPKVDRNVCESGTTSRTNEKISIFLQEMKNKEKRGFITKVKSMNMSVIDGSGLKGFVDVENEIHLIHKENMERLKKMTPEEIEETRKQLMSDLDPEIIEFLVNKNNISPKEEEMEDDLKSEESKASVACETADLSHVPITTDEIRKNKWLNMNVVEEKKYEWMKPIDPKRIEISGNINARFNFEGLLIKTQESYPISCGLYNHGDEPERAGYSLNELITFIQSSLPSQKILGLQTLGNIMERVNKGFYDSVFVNPIQEELLSNTDILLVVRKCLDDTSDTILAASIHCLHGLICNTVIDELYLDRMFAAPIASVSSSIPPLCPEFAKGTNVEEYTDSQLVREDAILGLLRTDILPRFRYIIHHYLIRQNDKLITEKLFDVLIRIARHSNTASRAIFNCDYLIETITDNYLPGNVKIEETSIVGNPSAKVLKLLRIIITMDGDISLKLFASFPQLWDSIQVYITVDPFMLSSKSKYSSSELLKVSIETMRMWCVLMSQKDSRESNEKFEALFPLIIKQLQFCLTLDLSHRHEFDWQYAATLLHCITCSNSSSEIHRGLSSIAKTVVFQWIRELINNNLIPQVDVIICIAAAVEYLFKLGFREDLIENFVKPFLNNNLLTQKFFSRLMSFSSVIFCNKDEKARLKRDAKSLPSLHFVYFAGEEIKLNKIFNEESVFSLFVILITVLKEAENKLIETFLMNTSLLKYIDCVSANFIVHEFNYLETLEINALATLINLSTSVTTFVQMKYHNLTLNILCCVSKRSLQEKLVEVVFNRSIYDKYLDIKLSVMTIDDCQEFLNGYLELIPQIKEIYLQSTTFKTSLWIYDPIVNYFNNGSSDVSVVTRVLQYFVILTNYNESYLMNVCSLSVHFAEIATVFLLNDEVFFDKEVEHCLRLLLRKLLNLNVTLKSSMECVPHTSTFINFFDLFVNHFEFASYGNALFANYLLIFLQQSCDKAFKKKLLTENMYALRAILIPFKELILDIEKLLFPVESDAEIIELFLGCLLSKIVTPEVNKVVYLISIHHLHHSLIRNPSHLMATQPKTYHKLMRSVEMSKNERLKEHIRRYSHHDFKENLGFVCN